ncbi:MAG: SusC/RagA family TonB-linked outer membrane protein [Prevotella sp.]|nr:SusC/RagA family TonB-linked outer membrane protein [Prevotella sp.]MBR6964342.1 SusC/RagA family TonB-linked outer membrane protein [Prevotella sp.]
MKRRIVALLAFVFLLIGGALAQTKVSGIVVSQDDGEPVIGASVVVEGQKTGVITDIDGRFTIEAVSGKKLVVSYIGMETATVAPKNGMRVVLASNSEVLEDVVVTGMQKMDKRLFTGSSTKLSGENAKLDGVADVSRALEGRAAGVSVQNVSGTFGAAPKIRVRGATSIYGSSKPLWVVDGVIMEDVVEVAADDLASGDANTLISSAIAGLNSDDIESFQILKDGSATSIYGARAMAGVIVVTTKKGKAGQNRINYTGEYTMRLKPSYATFNIMNSQDQMSVYQELQQKGYLNYAETANASETGIYGKMYQMLSQYDPVSRTFALDNTDEAIANYLRAAEWRNTNWFDLLFSNSIQHTHSVSMSGGSDKAQYYASVSAMFDPGWTRQSEVERYTANMNANFNISKKVSLGVISNASYRNQKAPGTLSRATDVVTGTVTRSFDINPYSYALNSSRALDPDAFYTRNYAPFNIFHELDNNFIDLNVVDFRLQGKLTFKPITKVELTALGAVKYSATTQEHSILDNSNQALAYRAMDTSTIRGANRYLYTDLDNIYALPVSILPEGGILERSDNRMFGYDFRGSVGYNDVFNDTHIVNAYGGMEVNYVNRHATWNRDWGLLFDDGEISSFNYLAFKQMSERNNSYYSLGNTRERSVAFFANATYSYKGRYTINGTYRYEGTNRLGKSHSARWLPTWNVSGAWNVHEEPWFAKLQPAMTSLTLKASYSLTADRGPANVTNSTNILTSLSPWRPFTSVKESAIGLSQPGNPELTYEKKHELNLGLESSFLDGRISLGFDWYKRNNFDLIGPTFTAGYSGGVLQYANVAEMKSSGVEVSISTVNVKNQNFSWTTSLIYSHTSNEVTKLQSAERLIDLVAGSGFTLAGYPVRSIFSIPFVGLNREGLPTFRVGNGYTTVTDIYFQETEPSELEFLEYSGSAEPTDMGSLGNIFKWKGFTLNIYMTYSFGNIIRLDPVFSSHYNDLVAMPKEFKNRWMVPGDEQYTDIPVIASTRQNRNDTNLSYAYSAYNYSTARIAKGDFVRMKEISIGYDFPKNMISKIGLTTLGLKLQATNPFLIYSDKKLNGQDPEFTNSGGVAVPMPKQFTMTLRIGL